VASASHARDVAPEPPSADIRACYELWSSKGADFVTLPIDRGAELRCNLRDPDGYMIPPVQSSSFRCGSGASDRLRTPKNSALDPGAPLNSDSLGYGPSFGALRRERGPSVEMFTH
jgi:hypothetical protein